MNYWTGSHTIQTIYGHYCSSCPMCTNAFSDPTRVTETKHSRVFGPRRMLPLQNLW